jgi:FkbM family methyltransferase
VSILSGKHVRASGDRNMTRRLIETATRCASRSGLKSFLIGIAPQWVLRYVKKRYYLRFLGLSEQSYQPEFMVIKELVRAGETVIDIGANIGLFTYYLSRVVGSGGVVHSIEPIPLTSEILSNSVEKLGLLNVRLWRFAASDHNGTALMEIPRYTAQSTENFYRARIVSEVSEDVRRYCVDLRSLDSLPDISDGRPSFIKIDVEGHELPVVKGAIRLISASKPSLLIEVSGDLEDPISTAAELSRCLEKEGYRPYWLDGDRLRVRQKGVRSVNYFYLTAAHLRRVDTFLEDSETFSSARPDLGCQP